MKPIVSIILPFYNAETTLSNAIESILNQTLTDLELLLVNNNSTDNSFQIAKEFEGKDSRIKVLNEQKQGVANAMNCGLRNACGKYLARMDADDVAYPFRLEKQVFYLDQNPETGLVGCKVNYISHSKNTDGFERFVNWVNKFNTSKEIELNRFVEIPIVNPTILFRRELFEKFGGCLDGDFPEDYEMQLRYLNAGIKMFKLPEILLDWHDSSARLTRTDNRYSTEAFFRTKAEYFKKWSEKNNRFHPNIWIWGAGRKTRQRANLLEDEGLIIEGYVDIIKSKTSRKPTLYYKEISEPGKLFIVSMVTNYGARDEIKKFLQQRNFIEGEDFILMG